MANNTPATTRQGMLEAANRRLVEVAEDIANNYMVNTDSKEAIAVMANALLDAEDFESMFDASSVDDLQEDLMKVGLHVEEITFNKSDFQDGIPFYATFTGKRLDNGRPFIANCGAWQVVLVAYKCVKNNWLPRNFMFERQEKATRAGYHPVNIYPWDEF
jgi:hypothetical protein